MKTLNRLRARARFRARVSLFVLVLVLVIVIDPHAHAQIAYSRINSLPVQNSPADTYSIPAQAPDSGGTPGTLYRIQYSKFLDSVLPSQTGNSGKILNTNGTTASWVTNAPIFSAITSKPTTLAGYGITDAFSGAFSALTGKPTTLNGYGITDTSASLRSAITDETGTGLLYFQNGALGAPSSGTLTNATGLPISTGVAGLASGAATFLATPTLANLKTVITDETSTGWNLLSLTNPGAVSFLQINADNSVTAQSASAQRTAMGAQAADADLDTYAGITPSAAGQQLLAATNALNVRNIAGASSGLWPTTQGGTGTGTPALVAGTNVTITGAWPNNTINAAGSPLDASSITGQTEDLTPDDANDYFLTYDASASALKKVKLANFAASLSISGVTDPTSGFTATFDFSGGTANRQAKIANGASTTVIPGSAAGGAFLTAINADGSVSSASPVVSQTMTDANQTLTAGTTIAIQTATLTASRTKTLPSATNYTTGDVLQVVDGTGTATSSNSIVIAPNGAETINGANSSISLTIAYGQIALRKVANTAWETLGQLQPFDNDLITYSSISPTAIGQALLAAGSSSVGRNTLGASSGIWPENTTLPAQTGNSGKVLSTNGTATLWYSLTKSDVGLGSVDNTSDASKTSTFIGATHTYAAGAKQIFAASATTAGEGFSGVSSDPSSLSEGDHWYRTDLHRQRLYDGTAARSLMTLSDIGVSGGAEAWDTDLDTWATKTAPSGTAVGTSDTQTLSNKTLDATTTTYATDLTAVPNNTGGWSKYAITGSDSTITTTLADITGLVSGTLSASTRYEFEANIVATGTSDANGTKFAIHGAGTGTAATANCLVWGNTTTATTSGVVNISAVDSGTIAFQTYASPSSTFVLRGFFTSTSTGTPTLSVQAQHPTSGTTTFKVGSVLRLRKADS